MNLALVSCCCTFFSSILLSFLPVVKMVDDQEVPADFANVFVVNLPDDKVSGTVDHV